MRAFSLSMIAAIPYAVGILSPKIGPTHAVKNRIASRTLAFSLPYPSTTLIEPAGPEIEHRTVQELAVSVVPSTGCCVPSSGS